MPVNHTTAASTASRLEADPAEQLGQARGKQAIDLAGPRLVDGVETLARLLHPAAFCADPLPPGRALASSPDGARLEPLG